MQLLHITASASFPYNTRLASALCFKNFIKRNWTDEDGNYKLQLEEVTTIKQELISLMISVPPGIQTQLGEAVSVIADSDFWERWDTLVDVSCQATNAIMFDADQPPLVGPRFQTAAKKPPGQQWCAASCALDLQAMETFVPVERTIYGD